jgi:hypothetical protein
MIHILYAFAGAAVGFVAAALMAARARPLPNRDTDRLNWLIAQGPPPSSRRYRRYHLGLTDGLWKKSYQFGGDDDQARVRAAIDSEVEGKEKS